jgi:4-amino-4-deoxy-L-arabinose transferase-like glycosyltransferase
VRQRQKLNWRQGLGILGLIWLVGLLIDRLWFSLDYSVPSWDNADYLNGALNYWQALQHPQWLQGDWWRSLWLISPKIPPLHYILTVPFLNIFGTSQNAASLVMLFYSGIVLLSVYSLGVALFDVATGLWAAGLCQLLPGLYYYRLEFLLDYPLTAAVTASFALLTLWQQPRLQLVMGGKKIVENSLKSWLLAIILGIALGCSLLIKQTALFFLLLPIAWLLSSYLINRQWLRLFQLIISLSIALGICFPWYRTNWLLMLTSGKRATVDSAIAEGDPLLNSLDAWIYYWKVLPNLISWHLLLLAISGWIYYSIWRNRLPSQNTFGNLTRKWRWLIIFLLGGYFFTTLNINKDPRYILPLLPVIALLLAVGLLAWQNRQTNYIANIVVVFATVLMLFDLFPLNGEWLTAKLSPDFRHYPYMGQSYPHPQVIEEIIQTSPYLRSTLGVLPSTPEINQHNFSFYGGQKNFQVVGRQVGVRRSEIQQDVGSLDWFLTKTGEQGSIPESQAATVKLVEDSDDFILKRSWNLPDRDRLKLYYRHLPLVEVNTSDSPLPSQLTLNRVILPAASPPGVPIQVTYEWTGSAEQLQSGIVLLTWQSLTDTRQRWLHDRSIGMGAFFIDRTNKKPQTFQVIERTAMLPPKTIASQQYKLIATYLDRTTGKATPLSIPQTTIKIASQAPATLAPELDLASQLREIAPAMKQGIKGLEGIFAQTARINQYDARQDYLKQTELALAYRLQHDKLDRAQQLDWLYTVGLARVLQQNVAGSIDTFQKITQLDSQNPFSYAYLAFIYLYDWQPQNAEIALNTARKIEPDLPEIKTLQGVAALMQGKLLKAWALFKS